MFLRTREKQKYEIKHKINIKYSLELMSNRIMRLNLGLLYHRTCKPDFLCSWPSLNSYLK